MASLPKPRMSQTLLVWFVFSLVKPTHLFLPEDLCTTSSFRLTCAPGSHSSISSMTCSSAFQEQFKCQLALNQSCSSLKGPSVISVSSCPLYENHAYTHQILSLVSPFHLHCILCRPMPSLSHSPLTNPLPGGP